jgi:hypothetical protein
LDVEQLERPSRFDVMLPHHALADDVSYDTPRMHMLAVPECF